jgi:hypothetical protein
MSTSAENTLGERIAPGLWMDVNGAPHWSIPELLELVDLPDTPENRAALTEMLRDVTLMADPAATIVYRERP